MPTPAYIGGTDFRIVGTEETSSRTGPSGLTITLKGRATALQSELLKYPAGSKPNGYNHMYLDTKSSTDRGPLSEIVLNYIGSLSNTLQEGGRISTSDSISRQSVSITTDEDENVSFFYYAQQTTTVWLYYGPFAPASPRYRISIPTTVPLNQLFGPNPSNFTGSIKGQYKIQGRLAQFDRPEVAPGVYVVTESWDVMIEPISKLDNE